MEKWKCRVCGYLHQGDTPPEICPKCGTPRSQFEAQEVEKEGCAFSILLILALTTAFCLNFWSCDNSETTINNAVVKQEFDLNRYLGKW